MRIILSLLLFSTAAHAQHTFQVSTIKPSPQGAEKHMQVWGTRFKTSATTVDDLLIYAYNIHPSQIIGGPEWLKTAKYDVFADPEVETRPSSDEFKAMLGLLLEDRFHLVLRREKRELPVYALVKTSKQPKMIPEDIDPSNGLTTGGLVGPGQIAVRNGTVTNFVSYLQRYAPAEINRPVIDQTGISGRWHFELNYLPISAEAGAATSGMPSEESTRPGIFRAIQEQLGLKLKPTVASIDVFVVDSVTPPTQN